VKNFRKRCILCANLVMVMLMVIIFSVMVPSARAANSVETNSNLLPATIGYLQQQSATDWSAFAISRAGGQVNSSYSDQLDKLVKQNKGHFDSITDLERAVIAAKSTGSDPTQLAGYNLIQSIYNEKEISKSGNSAVIFGLLALDSGDYAIPANAPQTQQNLTASILGSQSPDGGWSYAAGEDSSIDVTAMAITALSPYYGENPKVKNAVDLAVAWLSARQNANGGFNEMGLNSESSSQVIIALCSLGIDPTSAAFTKSQNVIDNLGDFRQADGGYAHMKGAGSNQLATEQALEALTAYQLFLDDGGALFYHIKTFTTVSLSIEGPQSTLAAGTVQTTDVLSGLQKLAKQHSLSLDIKNSAYGKYVNSIAQITAAGNNGWLYAVKRNHVWIYPQVSMVDFTLQLNDQVVVYYGGNTNLIESVKFNPEQPKAGQEFTATVQQSSWDWSNNKAVITPAAGVMIQIGLQQQTTDAQGTATFQAANATGFTTAIVTGYRSDAAPTVVKDRETLVIIPRQVNIHLDVEGPAGHIMGNNISAFNVLDALQQLAFKQKVSLVVKDSAYGKYLTGVGDVAASNTDGWMFAVLRNDTWIYPDTSMDQFDLRPNDQVFVYFGFNAKFVQSVQFIPQVPQANKPLQIAVIEESWDYVKNERVSTPGANLAVTVNAQKYTTNADGIATIPKGLAYGNYQVVISGYQDSTVPSIVRYVQPLQIYSDFNQAAAWAQSSILQSGFLGLMQGSGGAGFSPEKQVTRAELAATIARLLHLPLIKQTQQVYTDVPADSWYAEYIAALKTQGIVTGLGNGSYAPDKAVTREQMALMLARALKLQVSLVEVSRFQDAVKANTGSVASIDAVDDAGLMKGVDGTHFDPQGLVSREMLAVIAVRANA